MKDECTTQKVVIQITYCGCLERNLVPELFSSEDCLFTGLLLKLENTDSETHRLVLQITGTAQCEATEKKPIKSHRFKMDIFSWVFDVFRKQVHGR